MVYPDGHSYRGPGRCPYFRDAYAHQAGRCTQPLPSVPIWDPADDAPPWVELGLPGLASFLTEGPTPKALPAG